MPTVGELLSALDKIAPPELAYTDDPIGLQVGRKSDVFDKALVSLDVSPATIEHAVSNGARAIVAHHAPIYHAPRHLAGDGFQVQVLRAAVKADISIIVAHTNWDAADGGVNDTLARALSLENVKPFGDDISTEALKLAVFVPAKSAQSLIDAMAAAGAGGLGLYRRCAFYSGGIGTFQPQPGASPATGEVGKREDVDEVRIEMRVPFRLRADVEAALINAHPYEEPAYDFWKVSPSPASLGRMGQLPEPLPFGEMCALVDVALGSRCELFGKLERKVSKIGVVGGSGSRFWTLAKNAGCDVLLTGECQHHEGLEASETGFALIEAGHYHTEQPGIVALSLRLREALPGTDFMVYEPAKGRCGRPDS
ncbi:MAG: Nif3-like dinuclear metal center hexameric protein [Armatimonadota bacterium]|nr:Nif3-like dinuclear metal center hexameric protein [Armatimonadota bacterium]